jgi:hypothetical protein
MVFFDLEKSGTIGRTPGQCSLKPIKHGNVPGKPERTFSVIAKLRLRQSKAKVTVV